MGKRVLSLCNVSKRDAVKRALQTSSFKVSFISALSEVSQAIHAFKPNLFIHDWHSQDESQSRQFHLRFGQSSNAIDLSRIILVPEITTNHMAFASDALIEKVHTYGAISLNLATEASMLLDAKENNELQRFLRETKLDSFRYSQDAIDRRITEIFEKYPHDPRVKMEYANLLVRKGQIVKAGNLVQELLNKDPLNLRANNLLARIKMKEGDFDEALSLLNRADLLSPLNPSRLMMLGDAFFGRGQLGEAFKQYERATSLDEEMVPEALKQMGRIKLEQGELEAAVGFFKNSASEEEAAGFFNNAAVSVARLQKFDEALALYESALKALKTDKLKPTIYFNIALSQIRLNRGEDAAKSLQRALHYNPDYDKAKTMLDKLRGRIAS